DKCSQYHFHLPFTFPEYSRLCKILFPWKQDYAGTKCERCRINLNVLLLHDKVKIYLLVLKRSEGKVRKKLQIGIDGFEKIRTNDFYYVDKTMFIKELLQNWGEVNLFTRPRRFGKTLNMSMLKNFFEIGGDPALFDGLKIVQEKELCEKYMGKFPVIFISLKSVGGLQYDSAEIGRASSRERGYSS